tara:strand:- start:2956 stop:3564 length:609 start_codon:yes stop_codon:yes gene_type:complete
MRSLILLLLVCSSFQKVHALQKILIFGDSLSSSYGIEKKLGWVELLQKKLAKEKLSYVVINKSIAGETTAGGLSRLPINLKNHNPDIVILELGANDGLRGLPTSETKKNLNSMISMIKSYRAKCILIGIQIPPNYGKRYTKNFFNIFGKLADTNKVLLVPFMFEGFAADRLYFLDDNIHPNDLAQPIILKNVWSVLSTILSK